MYTIKSFSLIVSVVILVWFIKGYNHDILLFAFDDHGSNLAIARLCIIGVCMCPFTSLDDEDLGLMDTDDDH